MRTEINEKQGRRSERRVEARVKEAKQGKNSWKVGGRGVSSPPNGVQGQSPWRRLGIDICEVYNCQKRNFLPGNAGHSRQIDI